MEFSTQYLAGLFDGEGCVRIQINKWTKSYNGIPKSPCYQLICNINMTDKNIIQELHKIYGGCFSINKRLNPKHRTCYHWILASRKAYNFLQEIYPYVIVKKEQIKTALEFQEHIFKCGRTKWDRNNCLSKEELILRHSFYTKLKVLKTI